MNYIIWDGTDSRNLQGLMICELPPITKPEMRVETTVIDGKDGDITDDLGYSSYDKTLKIGLFRNYNIDEIAKYFTGKGELIFSNEPDKIYYAEITEQIDFECLLKFKTANVKFHVQPHKYLLNEPTVELDIDIETEITVQNVGLEIAKPIITLYGEGIITIYVNNHAIFEIDIDDEFVTIDSEKEEAYKGNILKNRYMIGTFPTLKVGANVITWTGNLTKIEVQPRSRWI